MLPGAASRTTHVSSTDQPPQRRTMSLPERADLVRRVLAAEVVACPRGGSATAPSARGAEESDLNSPRRGTTWRSGAPSAV
jgi:hypothetical protein